MYLRKKSFSPGRQEEMGILRTGNTLSRKSERELKSNTVNSAVQCLQNMSWDTLTL